MTYNVFSGGRDVITDGEVPPPATFNDWGLYGDGSDGSYTSGDNLTPGKVYNFTDLTLNSGDTLSSTAANSGEPIIVKVQGNVDISGTIDLSGQGYASDDGLNTKFVETDRQGSDLLMPISYGTPGGPGKRDNTIYETIGGVAYPEDIFMNMKFPLHILSGTGGGTGEGSIGSDEQSGGGGGASYGANGNNGSDDAVQNEDDSASGGAGGGAMAIICGGDFSFTGTIDISGNDGSASTAAGGGGGGGGMFYAVYKGSLTDSGTKTVAGGTGGSPSNTSASGGDGANGTVLFESVS